MGKRFATAVASFEETLEGLDLEDAVLTPEQQQEMGRRAALLAVADQVWSGHLGPLLDGHEVQRLLGVRTRQAVSDHAKRGRILALRDSRGRVRYPAFQFGPDGRPFGGVHRILRLFREAGVGEWTVGSWFRTRQRELDGWTPAAWLMDERPSEALEAAALHSAARLGR